jgi:predicted RNA-binding protein with PUA-like domain
MNPNGEHFDPKATPEKPIWYMVDVRYIEPLQRIVTLENIKQNPLLADMPLVKRSRLSIQPVSEQEWQVILSMGGLKSK